MTKKELRAQIEKDLEQELKKNKELAKVFQVSPELKEEYIAKILDTIPMDEPEKRNVPKINPAWCRKCAFSHGEPPFEDVPEKRWCEIYRHKNGDEKPSDVYYEGGECEFYIKG